MIKPMISIRGKINKSIEIKGERNELIPSKGKLNTTIIREKPELENIEITPQAEEQVFKSSKYGFNEIVVKKGVDSSDANAISEDIALGKTAYVNNQKVEGTSTGVSTMDADATASDIALGKTAYVKNKKITGTIQTLTKDDVPHQLPIAHPTYPVFGSDKIEGNDAFCGDYLYLVEGTYGNEGKTIKFPISVLPIDIKDKNILIRYFKNYHNGEYSAIDFCVTENENAFVGSYHDATYTIYCRNSNNETVKFDYYFINGENLEIENISPEEWRLIENQNPTGYSNMRNGYGYATKNVYNKNYDGTPILLMGSEDYKFMVETNVGTMGFKKYVKNEATLYTKVNTTEIAKKAGITPEIILPGNKVLGINGAAAAVDTRDATAVASDIALGKTAYINNEKVIGTAEEGEYNGIFTTDNFITTKFSLVTALKKIDTSNLDTSKFDNFSDLFSGGRNLEEVPPLDTSNAISTSYMFQGCVKITKIPNLNTSKVQTTAYMFYNCTSLLEIPPLDTSNVTNMTSMFAECKNLKEVPFLVVDKVTSTSNMFKDCTSLTNLQDFNIPLATGTGSMFEGCTNLKTIGNITLKKTTNTANMFKNCTSLTNLQGFNLPLVTSGSSMFSGCTNLKTIGNISMAKITQLNYLFENCSSLEIAPEIDAPKCTSYQNAFRGCASLKTVPLIDFSIVINIYSCFNGCTSLVTIPEFNTVTILNMSETFKNCPNLSDESLNNILAMCTKSAITSNKRLAYVGLSKEQAERCKTLSNYQAFTNAGWLTGY